MNANMNEPVPGLYRHFKGNTYRVFGTAWPCPIPLTDQPAYTFLWVAHHTETGLPLTVYCETVSPQGEARYWACNNTGERPERLVIYGPTEGDPAIWARPLENWLTPVAPEKHAGACPRANYGCNDDCRFHTCGCLRGPRFERIGD